MNLEKMSLEELESVQRDLQAQAAKLKAQRTEVARALDSKRRAAALEADLDALRAKHGVQIVAPAGIAGAAEVGTPGA